MLGGLLSTVGAGESPPPTAGANLLEAELSQAGRDLTFALRTSAAVPLADLDPLPPTRAEGSRFLCLALGAIGRRGERRLCLGGPRWNRRIGLLLVNAAGRTTGKRTIPARVRRPEPQRLELALAPGEAGLPPHRYRWRVLENRRGCGGCEEQLPEGNFRTFRLRPVRAVGCTGGGAGLVHNGPADRTAIALTFDDGPSPYTDDILAVLREKHAHATFFELGQEMPGREEVMRRILRDGSEIGNHTMHHAFYPGYSDLAATSALIRRATQFTPCLFRPPGGAISSSVVETAGQLGMKTILWDVDPTDWSAPGSAEIYSRVVSAVHPGAVVIMHDGGGNRSGTLAALPSIIDTLRARGYRFPTVTGLLGKRMIYKPYG